MPSDTPSLSPANERFFARGKKLWWEYTHRPQPFTPSTHNNYLDPLSEDDRLALTYAQRAMRTSGAVDLEDGDDDEEVRYRFAERIRRGREFLDSLPDDLLPRLARLREVDQQGDEQRDMDWASMWSVNGGSDETRRAALPSILSTRSTVTTPVSTSTRAGKDTDATLSTFPSAPETPHITASTSTGESTPPVTPRSEVSTARPSGTPQTGASVDTPAGDDLRASQSASTARLRRMPNTARSSVTARSPTLPRSIKRISCLACC